MNALFLSTSLILVQVYTIFSAPHLSAILVYQAPAEDFTRNEIPDSVKELTITLRKDF